MKRIPAAPRSINEEEKKNKSGASYHCDITKKKLFEQLLCAKMILIYSIMIMMIYSINSRGEGEERNRKGNP
jgi:hypothetical protein